MINFKKMDEKDFVFINKTLSQKEEKAFSQFLKENKKRISQTRKKKNNIDLQKL